MGFFLDLFSANVAYASIDSFIRNADRLIVNPLINLLFALALVYFLYGLFEFIANGENDEKKTTGKTHMLWGIVGITIMMGVWVILGIVLRTFNITGINPEQGTVNLPN
ncbi:hypothetical protein A2W67_01975 [Candidatus Nomurabacteria bacterium RIFCSPLOWO2_02_40_28]|uniref:Uncharacterized protein n=2 Tax=Candidatus Nomuraibacteriota TaxID=1752729 RepID=A0A837HQJ9_9BACT|nr:MAG: hypothetical protein UT27_C0010G0006 [Candidatus Nomurabacteria bacterium GW2011_GWD2_39_12]KKR20103.1 MAG: hypothetical protein UT51_C0008G0006 [Candidatus Nomurabacteria bacterium GW2011_GWC2_39_41]KKR36620.1 MAG: hypothetical protein UT70_C0008G0006 [Candidatus Nomurabacteria bacterium GW2011_GWE2_40_10]KKR38039.1 MAG: hypothetical protein UT73_C0007G0006 [Candidatus Nomurabacteria bacterium GW2011_GWB1_40_11]KKR39523.1 MAG: hypothetical protein UT74_C0010G0006 [Parcubacteria group b